MVHVILNSWRSRFLCICQILVLLTQLSDKGCVGLPGYAAGDMGPEVRLPGAALEGSLGPDSLSGQ